jgi:hypothetical protein
MPNANTDPADVINRALDDVGAQPITDIRDGSNEQRVAVRHYGPTIRELLRAAPWNFARKERSLSLAKDRTNTDGTVPIDVPMPWLYEYLLPQDCVKLRFVPQLTPQQPTSDPPQTTNPGIQGTYYGAWPAPYVIANDVGVPNEDESIGVTVILTNVQNALGVYTAAVMNPVLWDPLFMQGVVALLAAKFALPLAADKKLALEMRQQQIAIAKDIIGQARVANGNESWTTVDHLPDWIRVRGSGGWPGGFWTSNQPGLGNFSGWDSLYFPDGSAY